MESLNLFLFGFPALFYFPFVNFEALFTLHWTWWLLLIFLGANTFIAYTCLAQALKIHRGKQGEYYNYSQSDNYFYYHGNSYRN